MSMKRTELEKRKAKQLEGQVRRDIPSAKRGPAGGEALDRRAQREQERALGLLPFAVKLNAGLVKELRDIAEKRQVGMNELVAELLRKGLDG